MTMPQPIPSNSIHPLQVGEHVQLVTEWQDPGDGEFACMVIEAPADSPRVLIRTLIPDMTIQPTETIEASKLVRVINLGDLTDMDPEAVIREHGDGLTREQRLFFIEKFPSITLESLGNKVTPEEVELLWGRSPQHNKCDIFDGEMLHCGDRPRRWERGLNENTNGIIC
jgi:hypothetical protein